MSLEVDRRGDLPIKYPEHEDVKYAILQPDQQQAVHRAPWQPPNPQGRRLCGLRPTTLILTIALVVVTALAVVAAGVGGSLAAKNKYVPVSSPSKCVKLIN